MMTFTQNPALIRYGRKPSTDGLTLKALEEALKAKPSKKDAEEAFEETPVVAVVREKEETYLKKARGLQAEEQAEIALRKIAPWSKPYKGLDTPVSDFIVSPRWEAVKNAHIHGALGAGFGTLFGNLATNYAALAASTANALHHLPFVGEAFGNGQLPVHWADDHSTLPIAVGVSALAGKGAAIGNFLRTEKENADYESLIKFHPEKPSKANLLFDDRVNALMNGRDANNVDHDIVRRFLGIFAPHSALPGEILPNKAKGWFGPFRNTAEMLRPLTAVPVVGGAMSPAVDAIERAQNGGAPSQPGFNWGAVGQQVYDTPGQVYGLVTQPAKSVANARKRWRDDRQAWSEAWNGPRPSSTSLDDQIKRQELEKLRLQNEARRARQASAASRTTVETNPGTDARTFTVPPADS
jgi:hypothetical protein